MTQRFEHHRADPNPTRGHVNVERQPDLVGVLDDVLGYARRRDYAGPDYCDGMSSRLLGLLPFESKWTNLAVQETVKRAPIDLRPLFLVEERRNYKGTALFAMANLNRHALESTVPTAGDVSPLAEADGLLEWLLEERSTGYHGFCGGHNHEIQHLDGKGVPNDPDVVSTSYAVKALLAGDALDGRYADVAETASDFVVHDLEYREIEEGAKINYHMNHGDEYYTLNAGAIGARLLVDLHDRFGTREYRERARKILDFVVSRQTDVGGWYYRDPPDASHLSMDNHHNGFVLESLQRYEEVVDDGRYDDAIGDSLAFHRRTLFEPDGAPNFDESSAYPRDVHAAAQGILVFTYAGEYEVARRIVDWTLEHLYDGEGRFYFRKHRYYTKRITLMRWCQAWMAYALSEYLTTVHGLDRASSLDVRP